MRHRPSPAVRLIGIALAIAASIGVYVSASQAPALRTLAAEAVAQIDGEIAVPGLAAPVRVVRDKWGIPHIYAASASDLFFAQGYVMAQDRLWQMEMWRRTAEGRLGEVLGPQAFARDRMARLLKYRGPMDDTEWTSYHPEARGLMTAYVAGVNAFIARQAGRLPVEFVLTGITPEPWTVETLVLRQNSFGDAATSCAGAQRRAARRGRGEQAPQPRSLGRSRGPRRARRRGIRADRQRAAGSHARGRPPFQDPSCCRGTAVRRVHPASSWTTARSRNPAATTGS